MTDADVGRESELVCTCYSIPGLDSVVQRCLYCMVRESFAESDNPVYIPPAPRRSRKSKQSPGNQSLF